MSFNQVYQEVLAKILDAPVSHTGRLDSNVQSLHGITLSFNTVLDFPQLMLRPISPLVVAAECMWNLSGVPRLSLLHALGVRIWDRWADVDHFGPVVKNAYGFRWRSTFNRDQLFLAMNLIKHDPGTRHAVVMAWDPAKDGLDPTYPEKNVPCILGFQLHQRKQLLDMTVMVRSQDMIAGFPHDIAVYSLMVHILAKSLELVPGTIHWQMNDAHIYESNVAAAQTMLERKWSWDMCYHLPREWWWHIRERLSFDDEVVRTKELAKSLNQTPAYDKIKVDVV